MLKLTSLVLSTGLAITLAGCTPRHRASVAGTPQMGIWAEMLARLRANPDIAPHSARDVEFSVRDSTESVLPGVRYQWGIYHSPYVSHRTLVVLGATWRQRRFVIENAQDWDRLYQSTNSRPGDSREAIQACAEFATSSRPRRGPYGVQSVVSREREFEVNVLWGDRIRAFASEPVARRGNATWSVVLTIIEPGKVVTFECAFPDRGQSALNLADSLVGPGYAR